LRHYPILVGYHRKFFSGSKAFEAIKQFVGDEILETELKRIIDDTLCFDFPVPVEDNSYSLELFRR